MHKLIRIGRVVVGCGGFFSLDQIIDETKIERKYCRDVLSLFVKWGYLKKVFKREKKHRPGLSPQFAIVYVLSDKKGLEGRISPRLRKGTAQDRLWMVIRVKKKFNLRDLITISSVNRRMTRYYLSALRRKGIICPSRTGGGPGVSWTLLKDVGVRRPNVSSND